MSSENPGAHQDPATLLVLLGPVGMEKKKWMRFIVESCSEKFHIVRIFTTRRLEAWEDRPFYSYVPDKEFKRWIDLEEVFWGTYERQEGKNTFSYGFLHQDLKEIPEEMCGILTLDSLPLFLQLQSAVEGNDFITLRCLRIIPYGITEENNILVQNLRALGITDEREIKKRRKVAALLEEGTGGVADVTVWITGNLEADARQIRTTVSALCPIQIQEEEDDDKL